MPRWRILYVIFFACCFVVKAMPVVAVSQRRAVTVAARTRAHTTPRSPLRSRTTACASVALQPASVISAACAHARRALLGAIDEKHRRIIVHLPIEANGNLCAPTVPLADIVFAGGMRQRFAEATQPIVADGLLEGVSDVSYHGVLESQADGMGVWSRRDDFTLVTHVGDQTFDVFLKLLRGEFGERVMRQDHAIVLVNPYFTKGDNVGQPWDVKLREAAREELDDAPWITAYAHLPFRTAGSSRLGTLYKPSHDRGWRLHAATESGWNAASFGEVSDESMWDEDPCAGWHTERMPDWSVVKQELVDALVL